ncbi:MAG: GNAT family N-acetyltransferase [Nanoarchaeota archaeon]
MLSGIEIRKLTSENEVKIISHLRVAHLMEEFGKRYDEEKIRAELIEWRNQGRDFWRADSRHFNVGYSIGHKEEGGGYYADAVFVLKRFRRMKIGSELGRIQVERARELGCNVINTRVLGENKPSIGFQRRLGFEVYDSGGIWCTRLVLKILSP